MQACNSALHDIAVCKRNGACHTWHLSHHFVDTSQLSWDRCFLAVCHPRGVPEWTGFSGVHDGPLCGRFPAELIQLVLAEQLEMAVASET